jgi:hypothetical protein
LERVHELIARKTSDIRKDVKDHFKVFPSLKTPEANGEALGVLQPAVALRSQPAGGESFGVLWQKSRE